MWDRGRPLCPMDNGCWGNGSPVAQRHGRTPLICYGLCKDRWWWGSWIPAAIAIIVIWKSGGILCTRYAVYWMFIGSNILILWSLSTRLAAAIIMAVATGRSFLWKKYAAVISPGLSYQSYDCKYICSNKSDSRLWLLKFLLEKKYIYIYKTVNHSVLNYQEVRLSYQLYDLKRDTQQY